MVEPEIPPNTGNIARTCAATRTRLHLVEPLGFSLSDRYLKRAGVDYWGLVDLTIHSNWEDLVQSITGAGPFHFFTSHGGTPYHEAFYGPDDVLVFGRESRGLPAKILEANQDRLRVIPMTGGVRSLNLSNAVAISLYEALRQQTFQFPSV